MQCMVEIKIFDFFCSLFILFSWAAIDFFYVAYTELLPGTIVFTITLIHICVLQFIPSQTRFLPHLERLISSAEISGRAQTDGFLSCTLYSRIFPSHCKAYITCRDQRQSSNGWFPLLHILLPYF